MENTGPTPWEPNSSAWLMRVWRTFALGGASRKPPKAGGGGSFERGSHDKGHYFLCAKGARRKILSTMVYVKRVLHAYPLHVAGMIQYVVLTRVHALSSRYAVILVT